MRRQPFSLIPCSEFFRFRAAPPRLSEILWITERFPHRIDVRSTSGSPPPRRGTGKSRRAQQGNLDAITGIRFAPNRAANQVLLPVTPTRWNGVILSNRLKQLREARGLTLEALALKLQTTNQQISHLELGKRQLTVAWLQRLAAALGCHPWELVEDQPIVSLSSDELALLVAFRDLPLDQRAQLIASTRLLVGANGPTGRKAG